MFIFSIRDNFVNIYVNKIGPLYLIARMFPSILSHRYGIWLARLNAMGAMPTVRSLFAD